jgi:hypothetical protein
MLGHPSIQTTRSTAKQFGLELTGKMNKCVDCILAKVKRTNIPKESKNKAKEVGLLRLCMDVSYIKKESLGNNCSMLRFRE